MELMKLITILCSDTILSLFSSEIMASDRCFREGVLTKPEWQKDKSADFCFFFFLLVFPHGKTLIRSGSAEAVANRGRWQESGSMKVWGKKKFPTAGRRKWPQQSQHPAQRSPVSRHAAYPLEGTLFYSQACSSTPPPNAAPSHGH